MGAIRAVAVSGACYTGKTVLAKSLAASLGWEYVGAGQRFRERCAQKGWDLNAIPDSVHIEMDERIRRELATATSRVFEGRYLGVFAKDLPGVLRVRLDALLETRIRRCMEEEDLREREQAIAIIHARDERERDVATRLVGASEFLRDCFFEIVMSTDDTTVEACIAALKRRILEQCQL